MLEAWAEYAENRACRSNLRFVGFPEGAEGSAPETFLENWLSSWLPPADLSCFIIERAHRSLMQRPPAGASPRLMIAKILNYKDRDLILRRAREARDVYFESTRIMIFPDYTTAVQKQRKSYNQVKTKLRSMNLRYMLLYSAKLKVLHADQSFFFSSPEEAWTWATEQAPICPHQISPGGSQQSSTNIDDGRGGPAPH